MNVFEKFQLGLKKTSSYISSSMMGILSSNKIDKEVIDDLESILINSDIGLEVTDQLIKKIQLVKLSQPDDSNTILKLISAELETILKPKEKLLISNKDNRPTIILFIGVNGSGKTTTIGKIIKKIPSNCKILVGACDTFRAAAVEQLKVWTVEQSIDLYEGKINQDPASVAYSASFKAKEENYDYLIIDTAGRLSNNTNLLNQLIKIKSVLSKTLNENHIKTVLVLDGTNGSNMIKQVEIFNKSLSVNGLIITKIDGTAKGGALISIAKKYEIPIHYVGLGEKIDDLHEFDAKNFAQSMLGING